MRRSSATNDTVSVVRPDSRRANANSAGRPSLLQVAFAAGGVAWFTLQAFMLAGKWTIPGGDIRDVFLASGMAVRDGISPYYLPGNPTPFFYAPPWAVGFAALSYLSPTVVYFLILAAQLASLRYMAVTRLRFCYLLWFPVMPFEILGGAINLIVAGSIVAAVRGHAWFVMVGTLAKLSPLMAADPRQWRRYVLPAVVLVLVTVPWFWLWPAWVGALLTAISGPPLGPLIPIPLAVRLPVAIALIAYGRPWMRALGATIALPAFYYGSIIMLVAPLAVWMDRKQLR